MAEVKWIKIVTDVFNNKKIKQIDTMPGSDTILVIWFKLLCLAGNINEKGSIILTKDIAYTDEMLSTEFRKPLNKIHLALKTFESFGMIELVDNVYHISNWERYQNIEGLEKIREQTRLRVDEYREKQKALPSNVTVTHGNETDLELELEVELDKSTAGPSISPHAENLVVTAYGSLCPNLLPFAQMTEERGAAIAGLLKAYSLDQVKDAFHKYNASEFCRGGGAKKWVAGFDFAIRPESVAKALGGFYDGTGSTAKTKSKPKVEPTAKKRYDDLVE